MSPKQLAKILTAKGSAYPVSVKEIKYAEEMNALIIFCDNDGLHFRGADKADMKIKDDFIMWLREDDYEVEFTDNETPGSYYIRVVHDTPDAVWDITTSYRSYQFKTFQGTKTLCNGVIIKI